MQVWRSEDNLEEWTLSFHSVGSRNQIWVIRLALQAPLPTEPISLAMICVRDRLGWERL